MKDRIQWIDHLKGIAIVLVIIGHTIGNFYVRSIIFSVHMPIFFFLSGMNYSQPDSISSVWTKTWKNAKRLLIPAYLIWIIRFPIIMIRDSAQYTSAQVFNCVFYSSGSSFTIRETTVPAFGMMWFLVVLFTVRLLCDLISFIKDIKVRVSLVVALCVAGVYIGRYCYLPFSFDVTLVSVLFFYFGYIFATCKSDLYKNRIMCLSGFFWVVILAFFLYKRDHLELATRDYPYGALSIVMAILGCLFFCILASKKKNYGFVGKNLLFIGRNSMALFCIHAFDAVWWPYLSALCNDNKNIAVVPRVLIDLLILYIWNAIHNRNQMKIGKKQK